MHVSHPQHAGVDPRTFVACYPLSFSLTSCLIVFTPTTIGKSKKKKKEDNDKRSDAEQLNLG